VEQRYLRQRQSLDIQGRHRAVFAIKQSTYFQSDTPNVYLKLALTCMLYVSARV
jgi:hypothetical protein